MKKELENLNDKDHAIQNGEKNKNEKYKNKTKEKDIEEKKDQSKQEKLLYAKKEKRKWLKEKNRKKRARVVVRNLSFHVRLYYRFYIDFSF